MAYLLKNLVKKIQHSPIAPEAMERFKDEARKVLQRNRILDYSQEFLLETMFFLYRKRGYRI